MRQKHTAGFRLDPGVMPDNLAFGFYLIPIITNKQITEGFVFAVFISYQHLRGPLPYLTWANYCSRWWVFFFSSTALRLLFSHFLPYFSLMRCIEVFKRRPHKAALNPELFSQNMFCQRCIVSNLARVLSLLGNTGIHDGHTFITVKKSILLIQQ